MSHKLPLIIIADMGATFSRIAFIDEYQAIRHVKVYPSADYHSPKEVIRAYLAEINEEAPDHIFIAVAAPIVNDRLVLTNNHWDFSQQEISQDLNTKVTFINDFEALSLSLDHLSHLETIEIGQHRSSKHPYPQHSKVVIGTGTGFGTAISLQTDQGTISIPSEGGHALYSPQDCVETELVHLAIKELNRPIIVEDLLACKHGIQRLIRLMAIQENVAQIPFEPTPEGLLDAALEKEEPFAIHVLNRYCMMLGNTASNIALTSGAADGVYIGGGFSPRFSEFLQQSKFRECFVNKESVADILETVPTYLIVHPYATLVGLQQILPRYLS
ncbi:glucokinase [Ignatzschineria rhizosphaerae]|uniref:Glucokinase n=1 Tax=Ignatzschineria rhizosphaerae TaxID=2923279 RepID=A0ABY3X0A9_9GAMM|nr:ROK family protein [Ignatzschineria rhizosphaerae]UNM95196.1 glucokinase [Ignatzschineria rhizosphaerae]